jgi:hypothetical protein
MYVVVKVVPVHWKRECVCWISFGEMLLLIAIHFHAGQLTAIVDLACQVGT